MGLGSSANAWKGAWLPSWKEWARAFFQDKAVDRDLYRKAFRAGWRAAVITARLKVEADNAESLRRRFDTIQHKHHPGSMDLTAPRSLLAGVEDDEVEEP